MLQKPGCASGSELAPRLHSHSLTCTCKCMKFNHYVLLIIIFSITLLLVQMSLYSVNKLRSTLPPSGLKPILLDSGWFGSFLYALHNVNALWEMATWLAQLLERQSACAGGRRFEPQTLPTLRVLK